MTQQIPYKSQTSSAATETLDQKYSHQRRVSAKNKKVIWVHNHFNLFTHKNKSLFCFHAIYRYHRADTILGEKYQTFIELRISFNNWLSDVAIPRTTKGPWNKQSTRCDAKFPDVSDPKKQKLPACTGRSGNLGLPSEHNK